jgi:hypothetical protein
MKLHSKYLPFDEITFRKHFIEIINKDKSNLDNHLDYFKNSIKIYQQFEKGLPISKKYVKQIRQIEKDEKFWTASSFLTIYYSENRREELIKIFEKSYGKTPPLKSFNSWDECLEGELHLFFEPNLTSPEIYRNHLKKSIKNEHLIPYVIDNAKGKNDEFRTNLEGPTNVDAMIINSSNGFSIIIEAKVLSDISCQVDYDMSRNQIIRNIDVMLELNGDLKFPITTGALIFNILL